MTTETVTSVKSLFSKDKKAKKTYIFGCVGSEFPVKTKSIIESYLKQKFPEMPIIYLRQSADISKQVLRNIGLIFVDDSFGEFESTLQELQILKSKKVKDNVPTLFFTRDANQMVHEYRKYLSVYQEVDDYIEIDTVSTEVLFEKLTKAVRDKNRRKTKRFRLNLKVSFRALNSNGTYKGILKDLSLHGGLLVAEDYTHFRVGDQIHMSLPIGRYNHYETGEFVSLSARVRRIMITGTTVGISFEHMSEKQINFVREYLLQEVTKQI